jgi:hypothetical protein
MSSTPHRIFWANQKVTVDGSDLSGIQSVSIELSSEVEGIREQGKIQTGEFGVLYSPPSWNITITRNMRVGASPFFSTGPTGGYTGTFLLKKLGMSGWAGSAANKGDGTLEANNGSTTVTGSGTSFTSQFEAGDTIFLDGTGYTIDSVGGDTSITLDSAYSGTAVKGQAPAGGGTALKSFEVVVMYADDNYNGSSATSADTNTTYHDCLLNSLSYELGVDGKFTETITLTGYRSTRSGTSVPTYVGGGGSATYLKKEYYYNITNDESRLPTEVLAVVQDRGGFNERGVAPTTKQGQLQSFSTSLDIEYGVLVDQGKFGGSPTSPNTWRYITSTSCQAEITAIITRALQQDVLIKDTNFMGTSFMRPIPDRSVRLALLNTSAFTAGGTSFVIDLGKKNFFTGVSFSGGDTGGGNVEATFSYENYMHDFVMYSGARTDITQSTNY